MSAEYGHFCSVLLRQCFGDTVQIVADCLYLATARSLRNIVKATKLTRNEVTTALAILIKFQLLSFQISELSPNVVEYTLKRADILYILRYPRYVHLAHIKYGKVGSAIVEELVHSGSQTATNLIIQCIQNSDVKEKGETYREVFLALVRDNYLIRLPSLVRSKDVTEPNLIPKLHIDSIELFIPPEIDIRFISQYLGNATPTEQAKDADIFWQINFRRFHQDFRDNLMIDAIDRKLGANAAECFRFILKQMYERTDPWETQSSNPFTFVELKQIVDRQSKNLELVKYLDQYVSIIADDSLGFLRKVGEMGNGQYVVHLECAFKELSFACVENVITERFGSKASRIFRVIRAKKFIEQENLQKEAMIPAKESKLLSYSLFQEQFIHIKTIRKPGGGGAGPAKSFFLFHVNLDNLVRMLLDICYKALCNDITRTNYEKTVHKRLIEKSQKLDALVQIMKERCDSEEEITELMQTLTPPELEILSKVKVRLKILAKTELTVDDTIFLLQMYMHHTKKEFSLAKK